MLLIPAFGSLKQDKCHECEVSMGYIVTSRPAWTQVRPYLKNKQEKSCDS